MLHAIIDRVDWWPLLLVTFGAFWLITEIGYRFGRRMATRAQTGGTDSDGDEPEAKRKSTQVSLLVAALLGLLGLLLAFSFSIVESRFSARKELVLEEANAIGTAYLRAGTLPAPHDEAMRALLERYVDLRAPRDGSGITPEELPGLIAASETLHASMWTRAQRVARTHPESEAAALVLESLNDVIDLHQARVTTAVYFRLPLPILLTLYAVALFGTALMGYSVGLGRSRVPVATTVTVLVISGVLSLVVELDRPHQRIVHVDQRALTDVRQTIEDMRAATEVARSDGRT